MYQAPGRRAASLRVGAPLVLGQAAIVLLAHVVFIQPPHHGLIQGPLAGLSPARPAWARCRAPCALAPAATAAAAALHHTWPSLVPRQHS